MSSFWQSVQQSWQHEGLFGDAANMRNLTIAYIAGCLFAVGWWLIIDTAAVYPTQDQFPYAYHVLGAFTTLGVILIIAPRGDEDGGYFCGRAGSRFLIFFGFFLGFTCVIASIWIMFQEYVVYKGRVSSWPGVALFLQNFLIFSSGLVWKVGRVHDDYVSI